MASFPFFHYSMAEFGPWVAVFGVVATLLYLLDRLRESGQARGGTEKDAVDLKNFEELDPYEIVPLTDFDWRATEPLKFRNFKPKFHLTMGLTNITFSDLTVIDSNYLSRMHQRTKVIEEHHDIVIQAAPEITPAVNEFYTWLVNSYFPVRFPTLFKLTPTSLYNTATSLSLPLSPPSDPILTFELLGKNMDEDIIILLPSEDGDGYTVKGYAVCNAAGFNPKEKFGLKLRDIHAPVPGYKQKLEKSMDRFFENIEVGRVVLRSNWMVQTHPHLFAVDAGNHLYADQPIPEDETVDISQTYFRCERQTLHRLPNTKALVFMFKTYMHHISELKEEGYGEELATAIDGLKEGSVPGMWVYKKGVVWGEGVKRFLRS